MCANVVTRDNCAVIQLHGRFDFNAHCDVRGAVDRALSIPGAESVTVEMKRVDYLDSSALGMLLLVRDKARGANRNVALSRVNGSVRQVLDIANFGRLFAIS
ncbi:MAG: STAS domain-containing protein [Sterolibacteriaceae bacterium]|nr:STAS domain-containing protein [Sterolibacteriaceae bacterium]MBK9085527.1 STAS domain-containing protein [Sterolibacteriaceae bacterium]